MSYPNLSALLEAIVYLAKEPVSLDDIHAAVPEVDAIEIERTLNELIERYRTEHHGIEIREIAGGYRFSTKPEHHEVLKQFIKTQIPPTRLSLAALETLAVIAYRQPITQPELEAIRGVNSAGVIKTLQERGLIMEKGRKETVGRPILYVTTDQFLKHFGLKDLTELPLLEESLETHA